MNSTLISILAAVAASNARVAGMQAENQLRAAQGDLPTHREDVFYNEANFLDQLSIEARNAS